MDVFEHQNILFAFVTAITATVIATPFSLIIIKKLNLFDDPTSHKHPAIIHKKPIPRGGGIPLFIGIWVAAFIFLPSTSTIGILFLASFLALVIGVLDDKFDVSPYLRFFMNIFTAILIVGSGITIPFITNPLQAGVLRFDTLFVSIPLFGTIVLISFAQIIALLWIVWVMNMLNWSKGVDGQMPGIVAISGVIIGVLSLRFSATDPNSLLAATLSFIIAGSAVGFLFFNFYPAKIFPGYGATSMYLLLAVVSILSTAKLATAILVMGIPMIDGIFTIGRRIASGHSPFWHDNKHLHHLLLKLGMNQRHIALFYWTISAILGAVSLYLTSSGKLFAIIMLGVIVGGALLFLHLALKQSHDKTSV